MAFADAEKKTRLAKNASGSTGGTTADVLFMFAEEQSNEEELEIVGKADTAVRQARK